ncbi:MAG: polymerase subunit sigma [Herbaspirillum sp.]|nr:polymerase subunit sigma [Herbaspirillum sp.]
MSASAPPVPVFEQFVEQYYQWLLRFVRRKVANPEQAEDLLHDALLDAHLGLKKYRGEAALSAWVLGVLSNKIRRHYRCLAHMPSMIHDDSILYEEAVSNGDPSDLLSQTQRLDCLCRAVDKLPAHIKEALCQVALDGEAYALVARHLNIPVGTLRSQLSRAREHMRHALDAAGVGRAD